MARGLEKRFGALSALRGVDLEVKAGSVLAILGPNGAGKSTLLRLLAGLAQPTAGDLTLLGQRGPRQGIGYLGHASLLYPELSARENLVFAGQLQLLHDPEERADQLLEEEGLTEVGDRRAGTFSRGMAQRLSIARARVHDPALLLLDEPYTGLDRRSARRLTERLQALSQRGQSLVLVTHNIEQTTELGAEVVILSRGRIVYRSGAGELSADELLLAYDQALTAQPGAGARQ